MCSKIKKKKAKGTEKKIEEIFTPQAPTALAPFFKENKNKTKHRPAISKKNKNLRFKSTVM